MLTIKTTIKKYSAIKPEDYINIPIMDRVTTHVDLTAGIVHGNNTSKPIGAITNAEDLGNGKVELTITLWKIRLQGEYLSEANGKIKPLSYSMGFQNDERTGNYEKV